MEKDAHVPIGSHTPISLAADKGAAYWELRARVADVQRAEQVAQQAMAAVEVARGRLGQHLAALGAEHGFAPAAMQFRLDDETLSLHVTPEAGARM